MKERTQTREYGSMQIENMRELLHGHDPDLVHAALSEIDPTPPGAQRDRHFEAHPDGITVTTTTRYP